VYNINEREVMKVWVTRDTGEYSDDICLWTGRKKPFIDTDGRWEFEGAGTYPIGSFEHMSPRQSKSNFGFTPRKGSCKQYELSLKEIK